jgi:AcrR family transcriptional regulator
MNGSTRDRMIDAAVDGLRRHGVAGMSFTEVLEASGAARGAIYHHFPGGKLELVAAAAQRNGADVRERFAALAGRTPSAVVSEFLRLVRPVVLASVDGQGCAVAAVALGADGETEELRAAAEAAFRSWSGVISDRLRAAGLARAAANELATTLITLLEGAHVLCRAQADIAPFDAVATAARRLAASYG